MSNKRKTNFKWYYKVKGKRHLTRKAKIHLRLSLRRYWREKKIHIIQAKKKKILQKNAIYHIRGSYKKRGHKGFHPFILEILAIVPRDTTEKEVKLLAQREADEYFDKEGFFIPLEEWKIGFEDYTNEEEVVKVIKWSRSLT